MTIIDNRRLSTEPTIVERLSVVAPWYDRSDSQRAADQALGQLLRTDAVRVLETDRGYDPNNQHTVGNVYRRGPVHVACQRLGETWYHTGSAWTPTPEVVILTA